jgi:hypothetical protein
MQTGLKLKALLTAAAFAAGIATAPIASAQVSTTANGPYYATPSWDQKLTTNRFVILANWNNEAVLDRETGLVWERAPTLIDMNWFAASERCVNLTVGGRQGWRLPSVQELASLVDPTVNTSPRLPAGHPFGPLASLFWWSSTTYSGGANDAWYGSFATFGPNGPQSKGSGLYTWCVRGGQSADAQ